MKDGKGKKILFLYICFFAALLMSKGFAHAEDITLSDEEEHCLGCHAQRGIVKHFENNEILEVFVEGEKYKKSIHKSLTCSDCHNTFSVQRHPKRRFRTREQYRIRSSRICRRCHSDEQIEEKQIHASLLIDEEKGRASICTDCHGSHSVKAISGGRVLSSEKQYCMSCHGFDLQMECQNGEIFSLAVDSALLENSVHNKLCCSDCHFGFSSEEHPQRNFVTKRDYTIALSDSCRRCHFDKYTRTLESIHYSMLSLGNQNAPVCTDCHGAHSVSYTEKERIFSAKRCKKCHQVVYNTYAGSVHGNALIQENNQDVPVCTDCHKAHDIRNPLTLDYHEKIPEMCSKCHANKTIMGKYGLSTDVVKTYLADFHGVTLRFYRKEREALEKPARPIAVCTDCHGTHDIRSTIGSEVKEVRANLAKKCQKCHENVTENFPEAWLSHYSPSLANAPLVFIVSILYETFIPFMVFGLILQILLHIWRYAVNR